MPGIAEAVRLAARDRVPTSVLSRGLAGTVGTALVVNLPGLAGRGPRRASRCWRRYWVTC